MEKIIKNSARCNECGQEIVSTHRHDYVTCKCGNLAVDGGKDYLKRSLAKPGTMTDTSIIKEN